MDRLGMQKKNVVFLNFEESFWPQSSCNFNCPLSPYTLKNVSTDESPATLMALPKPWHVERMEAASDDHIVGEICGVLLRYFPDFYTPPIGYTMAKWGSDPLYYGSFAYYKPVARKMDNILLSLPLIADER